jgi:hypothetical protein
MDLVVTNCFVEKEEDTYQILTIHLFSKKLISFSSEQKSLNIIKLNKICKLLTQNLKSFFIPR